jgi:hypothetical protein
VSYVDDVVYQSLRQGGEQLDVLRIVKTLSKSIMAQQNFGKKSQIRQLKQQQLNVNFDKHKEKD